jgi:hypothetical protein
MLLRFKVFLLFLEIKRNKYFAAEIEKHFLLKEIVDEGCRRLIGLV